LETHNPQPTTGNLQPRTYNLKVPFNKPYQTGKELVYIQNAIQRGKISGNGYYTQKCQEFFEKRYGLDIQPGDEVIVPSFTFVSTANAFVLRGAKIVFVDSRADHLNLDEKLIEELITPRTKAILAVHYSGYPCEMDTIMAIAKKHRIYVVEDAAQAIDQDYKGRPLGGIGHLGTLSFHETKNIQCGEGGMLLINDPDMVKKAEIIWEKGTDRAAFFRGEIDKYGWVEAGSSFLPSELNAAFLWAQLENLDDIQTRRKAIWNDYYGFFGNESFQPKVLSLEYLEIIKNDELRMMNEGSKNSSFQIPHSSFKANAHIFYLLFPSLESRTAYAQALKEKGILAVFHYQSLHKSDFAQKHFPDQFKRDLPNSDRFTDCLLRLPLFYELGEFKV
jgi:dTDP-4-amino-4,6-dideoxygalactose transaminase